MSTFKLNEWIAFANRCIRSSSSCLPAVSAGLFEGWPRGTTVRVRTRHAEEKETAQNVEMTRVGGFAAGQVEGDDIPGGVRFCVDFRGEAAARTSERLAFLPPFAPAADTCARTTVESNI